MNITALLAPLFVGLIILAFKAVLLLVLKRLLVLDELAATYKLKPRILTPAETNAFRVLQLAKPPELLLLASVRLADVIQPTASRREDFSRYRGQLNRIIQKQLDFLLCDPETTRPLLAIELQDASHNSEKRRTRDELVTTALDGAGLPVLLLRTAREYSIPELRQQISGLLERNKIGQKGADKPEESP